MKLRRQHGLLLLSLLGTTVLVAVLAGGAVGQPGPATPPVAGSAPEGGDWEGVDYPALDRLIQQRAAAARAHAASLQRVGSTLAQNERAPL